MEGAWPGTRVWLRCSARTITGCWAWAGTDAGLRSDHRSRATTTISATAMKMAFVRQGAAAVTIWESERVSSTAAG